MKRFKFIILILAGFAFSDIYAQESQRDPAFQFDAGLIPINLGMRFDDNVFREVSLDERQSDEIYNLDWGGRLEAHYNNFGTRLEYSLGTDQYQFYSVLNNLKNNFDFLISATPGEFDFYYQKIYFIRNSQEYFFNYIDDGDQLGILWTPEGPWNIEAKFKDYSRQYYDTAVTVLSQNYTDQAVYLDLQREINEKFSIKAEGGFNDRQFFRQSFYQDPESDTGFEINPNALQTDQTWTFLLSAHLYVESILQDFTLEHQRTNSNSYGFSNSVNSASWAAVIRPAPALFIQLFFRLYLKNYDVTPLINPDLQIGYVDEDSQGLLSIKTTWEWASQWGGSLSLSRVRDESTQPGLYYIKNIISLQIQRSF